MNSNLLNPSKKKENIALPLIGSVLITLFLFFIDEGYYNFDWMFSAFNWIPFFIYAFCIFTAQIFVSVILLRKYTGRGKGIISVVLGTFLALVFLVGIVF